MKTFKNLPKEKRDRIVLTAVMSLLISGVFWSMMIRPLQSVISDKQAKLESAADDLEKARRLAGQADKIEKELGAMTAQLREIEAQMAQGDLYSWIIKTMTPIQANYKLDIPTFSPPGVGPAEVFPEFPYEAARYSFRGIGTFHEIGKFIADMENRFPFARFTSMNLVSNGKADTSESVSFSCDFVTLIKPTKEL